MARDITPTVQATEQLEVSEQPEGTRGLARKMAARGITVAAAMVATQVLHPAAFPMGDLFTPHDMTRYGDEEFVGVEPWIQEFSTEDFPAGLTPAESANHLKMELLAREYVSGQLSTEEEARLAIVTERVRKLIPRVTVEDFEKLEEIAKDLQIIEGENLDIERQLRALK